jgi:protein-tyrosine phosphatase
MTNNMNHDTRPSLGLETIPNARDLGGLAGLSGRRVRSGKLYRSANPRWPRPPISIACIRSIWISSSISDLPASAFGDWLAVPVLEGSMAMDVLVPRLRASTPTQMHDFMLDVYRDFPVRYREAFGAFLRHAEAGRTLFYHCTAGKDRTGFASLLLLSALGVSQDEIVANYLESNHWNRRLNEDVLARVAPIGVDADVIMPLLEVRPEYLEASMDAIAQAYGGGAISCR